MPKHPVSLWLISERKRHGWKSEEVARRLRDAGVEAADGTYRVWEAGRKPSDAAISAMETLFGSSAPKESPTTGLDRLAAAIEAQTAAINALVVALGRSAVERPAWVDEALSEVQDAVLGARLLAPTPRAAGARERSDAPPPDRE